MCKNYKSLLLVALLSAGTFAAQKAMAQTQTFSTIVASGDDDAEEIVSTGAMDLTSSDLELIFDNADQYVGMRFTNVTIPQGAYVTKAYIQFSVDEFNSDPANLTFVGQAADNAATFTTNTKDISSRSLTSATVSWNVPAWTVQDEAGEKQRTPDIKNILNEIIGRKGWKSGNALVIGVTGSGKRNAHAYNGKPLLAPKLVVEYVLPTTMKVKIASSSDDAEERGSNAGSNPGQVDLTSSDLELVYDGTSTGDQQVGLRFTGINIPKNAIIKNAYIHFTQDEIKADQIDKDPAKLVIKGENADNSVTFSTTSKDISNRSLTTASVNWTVDSMWAKQSEKGPNQMTPDLTNIVKEIMGRANWKAGNSLTFVITGTGRRFAQAYDLSANDAAELVIEYVSLRPAVGTFPVNKGSEWTFNDEGTDLGTNWTASNYDDSKWNFGKAVLGYGDVVTTPFGFGPDASNKFPATYLRHTFEAKDVHLYDTLVFNIRRDDGAVVYLNGTEQFRTNMPSGTIDYKTYASSTVDGANETTYFTFKVPSKDLVNGTNVLAVSMHQDRASSSDVTFDLEMKGQLKAVKTDQSIFSLGDIWKYNDNGSNLDTAWRFSNYIDTAWKSGNGVLGYGNGDEKTKLSFGNDAAKKHITTYFRKSFEVKDTADFKALELSLVRDDAAAVYINGKEVFRNNISGKVNHQTKANSYVEGAAENEAIIAYINKNVLVKGTNVVAVEVHKFNEMETDLRFDLGMKLMIDAKAFSGNNTYVNCDPNTTNNIGCFTSVQPTPQTQLFVFPTATHTFQVIAKSGTTTYTSGGAGPIPGGNDFTGFTGLNGSSTNGTVAINHENGTGAITMVGTHFNEQTMLWEVDSVHKVDFTDVVRTATNCSGGLTPWGTTITSEETFSTGDANNDGYEDVGWQVEMNPKTGKIMDYDGDGKADKLWAMGRFSHENIAVSKDSVTVFQAEDGGSGGVFKYVANKKGNLSEGTLYVLKRDSATATTGTWVQVPNTTKSDRNNTRNLAISLGGTNWSGPEDIEFGPDGMMYFTAKGTGTIWRFKDDGSKVSKIEAWVTNKAYEIKHESGVTNENWGTGIDNLTFDNEGNLWALQDGGRDFIWVIRPDHTPAKPHVELFATTPSGSEPTGLTFTPDFKYGFLSFQNPSSTNTATTTDAAGKEVKYNASTTIVFSRKQYLGMDAVAPVFDLGSNITSCEGETVTLKAYSKNDAIVKWNNNTTDSVLTVNKSGTYYATAYGNNGKTYTDSVTVTFAKTPVANLGADKKQCGGTVTLDAGNAGMQYLWSTGAKTKTLAVTKSGTYTVSVVNPVAGCVSKDTINVTIYEEPKVELGRNMAICYNCSVILNAGSGFSSYLWSDGSTEQFLKVSETGRYSVKVTDANGCTAIDFIDITRLVGIEDAEALEGMLQVYPNPFQNSTNIKLSLPENAQVRMEIFDMTGKKIETLADSKFTSGDYQFEFNPKNAAKGIYMLQLQIDNQVITKKLVRLND